MSSKWDKHHKTLFLPINSLFWHILPNSFSPTPRLLVHRLLQAICSIVEDYTAWIGWERWESSEEHERKDGEGWESERSTRFQDTLEFQRDHERVIVEMREVFGMDQLWGHSFSVVYFLKIEDERPQLPLPIEPYLSSNEEFLKRRCGVGGTREEWIFELSLKQAPRYVSEWDLHAQIEKYLIQKNSEEHIFCPYTGMNWLPWLGDRFQSPQSTFPESLGKTFGKRESTWEQRSDLPLPGWSWVSTAESWWQFRPLEAKKKRRERRKRRAARDYSLAMQLLFLQKEDMWFSSSTKRNRLV